MERVQLSDSGARVKRWTLKRDFKVESEKLKVLGIHNLTTDIL